MKAVIATIALSGAVAAGWMGLARVEELRTQVDRIDGRSEGAPERAARLSSEVAEVRWELQELLAKVERSGTAGAALERELSAQAELLDELVREMEEQSAELAERAARVDQIATRKLDEEDLDHRLAELDRTLEATWQGLEGRLVDATMRAEEARQRVGVLGERIERPRDVEQMWSELVGPVVQLAGESSVGSGVLLASQQIDGSEGYETYLLTAWHVVRDIQGSLDNLAMPVPVTIYDAEGSITMETATLLAHDAEIDVALLRLEVERAVPHGTTMAPIARLEEVRAFDRIYAVGCPLGNDPIPTAGEIASSRHLVDGDVYWMINAPTYIGNSGGGIFDADTHELLGIFSKIYNYGSMRPTIVPHMGLVTPLSTVYEWLDDGGHGHLVPGSTPRPEAVAGTAASD